MTEWLLAAVVGGLALVILYWLGRMYREYRREDRERFEYASSRGLIWSGAWQLSLALYMAAMGSWVNVVPLVGAGLFLIFSGWFQWRTRASRLSR